MDVLGNNHDIAAYGMEASYVAGAWTTRLIWVNCLAAGLSASRAGRTYCQPLTVKSATTGTVGPDDYSKMPQRNRVRRANWLQSDRQDRAGRIANGVSGKDSIQTRVHVGAGLRVQF